MLSRRCITATAGTSLVRDSLTDIAYDAISRTGFTHTLLITLTGMLVQAFAH